MNEKYSCVILHCFNNLAKVVNFSFLCLIGSVVLAFSSCGTEKFYIYWIKFIKFCVWITDLNFESGRGDVRKGISFRILN